jgi:Integrase zinc binding domain
VIKTDHISFKHLLEQKLHQTFQHNGLYKLLGLDYVIQYKRGVENRAADVLSRREHPTEEGNVLVVSALNPQWIEDLKESYKEDSWGQDMLLKHQLNEQLSDMVTVHCGFIRKKHKIYVGTNKEWRTKMIQVLHDSTIGGHLGILGTYQRVKKLFYWPKLKDDVHKWVQMCDIC